MKTYSGNKPQKKILGLLALLICFRMGLAVFGQYQFSDYDTLIIGLFPMIAIGIVFNIGGKGFERLRNNALYILFGAALCFLIGEGIAAPKEIHWLEWGWLAFALSGLLRVWIGRADRA